MRRLLLLCVLAAGIASGAWATDPLAHTYSIVARDPVTGDLGVAVQSHWFQVGATVPWAESGVGAVATQSFINVDYGPLGLALLKKGLSAQQALDQLIADDPQREVRQVAIIDAKGRVATWTGANCIAAAGHQQGAGFSVQANLMLKDTVWSAMARAYGESSGDLASRLLAALKAAQAEGGDIRGRQSAALIVVKAESSGKPWGDRIVDLRVDDNPEPLAELDRLLHLHRAFAEMNRGDDAMAEGDTPGALSHYSAAASLVPDNPEIPFWQAVTLFASGQHDEALPIFQQVFQAEPRWREVVRRLPPAGLLPAEGVATILGDSD